MKKQQEFLISKNLERQILAKVGQIKILRKYLDKIRVCLKNKKNRKNISQHLATF